MSSKNAIDPMRAIAPMLGLCGFAVACVAGFASGATSSHALSNAIAALLVCVLVGHGCAWVLQRVAREHLASPRLSGTARDAGAAARSDDAPGMTSGASAPTIVAPMQAKT